MTTMPTMTELLHTAGVSYDPALHGSNGPGSISRYEGNTYAYDFLRGHYREVLPVEFWEQMDGGSSRSAAAGVVNAWVAKTGWDRKELTTLLADAYLLEWKHELPEQSPRYEDYRVQAFPNPTDEQFQTAAKFVEDYLQSAVGHGQLLDAEAIVNAVLDGLNS